MKNSEEIIVKCFPTYKLALILIGHLKTEAAYTSSGNLNCDPLNSMDSFFWISSVHAHEQKSLLWSYPALKNNFLMLIHTDFKPHTWFSTLKIRLQVVSVSGIKSGEEDTINWVMDFPR